MVDNFSGHSVGLTAPSPDGFDITPSDSTDLAYVTRAIYVGGTGNLKVTRLGGAVLTYYGVPAGMMYPIRVTRVWATGTTATHLIGEV